MFDEKVSEKIFEMADEIALNQRDYTMLIAEINNTADGLFLLEAVRCNQYLTSCSILLNEKSPDIEFLRIIRKSIVFHIQDNEMRNKILYQKFRIFEEAERARHQSIANENTPLKP